ncbi:MAG TPA: pentapeptide repeat-containing protein [Ktedonobacteraceae bacterium]|nr:pentapeptide repeat-containing protein [Ktedonobacteraceae bacterium]
MKKTRVQTSRARMVQKGLIACGALFFFALILLIAPASSTQASAHARAVTVALETPTTVDPTVTALEKEQLEQQVQQLKNENTWYWTNVSTFFTSMTLILAGIAGGVRWFSDRRSEREKRAEERFQAVVTGLGAERMETQAGSAIMLHTFLQRGYEQFYFQAYELAVVHLRYAGEPGAEPIALSPLREALITVFKEAFPMARETLKQDPRSFNASRVMLDSAYLSGSDLRAIWMPHAFLRNAFLSKVIFVNASLSDSTFAYSDLKGATFANARLRRVDFAHADLSNAILTRAKLRRASFVGAKLSGADLSEAELPGADLTGANIEDAASLARTILKDARGLTPEQREICLQKGALFDIP